MTSIVLLSDDLIDASKVIGAAKSIGAAVFTVRDPDTLLQSPALADAGLIILDLGNPQFDIGKFMASGSPRRAPVVGFGSHVNVALLASARAAGCDLVLPRSAFFEQLEGNLLKWLAG